MLAGVGDEGVGVAESCGFAEALFELGGGAEFAAEADLADGDGGGGE